MNKEQLQVLQRARDTYGFRTQITIASEECAELIKELLKYLRFEDHDTAVKETKSSVVSEVADVNIVLNHVMTIFQITEEELNLEIGKKINRLDRWLHKSNSIEYTTKDRKLEKCCEHCFWNDHWDDPDRAAHCKECVK